MPDMAHAWSCCHRRPPCVFHSLHRTAAPSPAARRAPRLPLRRASPAAAARRSLTAALSFSTLLHSASSSSSTSAVDSCTPAGACERLPEPGRHSLTRSHACTFIQWKYSLVPLTRPAPHGARGLTLRQARVGEDAVHHRQRLVQLPLHDQPARGLRQQHERGCAARLYEQVSTFRILGRVAMPRGTPYLTGRAPAARAGPPSSASRRRHAAGPSRQAPP